MERTSKIIYGISRCSGLEVGTVKEFEVIKETDRTLTVTFRDTRFRGLEYRVRKSEMESCGWHFEFTSEEALKFKKEFLSIRIAKNESEITKLQAENEKLRAQLAEI